MSRNQAYSTELMSWFGPVRQSLGAAILQQLEAAKRGDACVVVAKVCLNCGRVTEHPLRLAGVERVATQYSVGMAMVDVALIDSRYSVVAALLFDGRRRKLDKELHSLHQRSIRWLVAAESEFFTTKNNQITWYPIRCSRPLCADCARDPVLAALDGDTPPEERVLRRRVLERISRDAEQPVPDRGSPYWAEPFTCWNCKARMLVYSWNQHGWMTDTPPPEPRPSTVRYRYSRTADGSYWVNVCPRCESIQGDNYVFAPAGPLRRPPGVPSAASESRASPAPRSPACR